jgi:hypothetical protein
MATVQIDAPALPQRWMGTKRVDALRNPQEDVCVNPVSCVLTEVFACAVLTSCKLLSLHAQSLLAPLSISRLFAVTAMSRERSLQGTRYHGGIVAHRCRIEASIGKHIESLHSPGHRSNHRAAQSSTAMSVAVLTCLKAAGPSFSITVSLFDDGVPTLLMVKEIGFFSICC